MNKLIFTLASLIGALALSQTALAAGFEKGIPWGGQASGLAGIGSVYMTGSQALYYNPAGLVGDKAGAMDVSANLSPTFPTFKGPIENPGSADTSKSQMYLPGALMFGQTVNDSLGWGVGVYVVGGNQAEFDNVMFGANPYTLKSNLTIMELAGGVGYKVMDNLKVGLAYRIDKVSASFDSPQAITSGPLAGHVAQTNFDNMTDTNYFGYKLGAQYKINDKNMLGLVYRSEMNFKAKGTGTLTVPGIGAASASDSNATIGSVLPTAINLSYEHDCSENWKSFAEVVWTQYSKVQNLMINSSFTGSAPIQLSLKDQTALRLAEQWSGMSWPVRFGLTYTSQVTSSAHPLATAIPPGPEYTLTVGTGQVWGNWRADGGLEYTMGSGNADASTGMTAQYSISEYALHLGTSYTF